MRYRAISIPVIVALAVATGCKSGQIRSGAFGPDEAPLVTEAPEEGVVVAAPATPSSTPAESTKIIEECLAPPAPGTEPTCQPCLEYLPKDADLYVAINTTGVEGSLVFAQLLSSDENFSARWAEYGPMLPKQICAAVKIKDELKQPQDKTASQGGEEQIPKEQIAKLFTNEAQPAQGKQTTESTMQGQFLIQDQLFDAARTGESYPASGTASAKDRILALLNTAVDEFVVVAVYEEIPEDVNAFLASEEDRLGKAKLDLAGADFIFKVDMPLETYVASKAGAIFGGTPGYLESAFSGPDAFACLAHPMGPVLAQFAPANIKVAAVAPSSRFQWVADKALVPDYPVDQYRHVAFALNLGDKAFFHFKAFAGVDLDPQLEFLTAVRTDAADPQKFSTFIAEIFSDESGQ